MITTINLNSIAHALLNKLYYKTFNIDYDTYVVSYSNENEREVVLSVLESSSVVRGLPSPPISSTPSGDLQLQWSYLSSRRVCEGTQAPPV